MRVFDTQSNQRTIRALLSEEDLNNLVVAHVLKAAGNEGMELTGHDKTQVFFRVEHTTCGAKQTAEVTITIDLDQRAIADPT